MEKGEWGREAEGGGQGESERPAGRPDRTFLLFVLKLLEQHAAAELAVFGAGTALPIALAGTGSEERIDFLFARLVLGRRRHVVEDGDQIEVGLTGALVAIG